MNKSSKHPSISIVIPNWNGVYLMGKHLKHVIEAALHAEVIVADDMSSDGSVEYLRTNYPGVVVVANTSRKGFAGNVNSGVAKATGDIIVLLNTDVEPEKGFLEPLVIHFTDKNVFAVGCLEKSSEKGSVVLRGRGLARWEKGYYVHARGEVNRTDTAWVSGGSAAFRRSMWLELGGMDRLFNPFYWEDIDLSYRARKRGWKTIFEPKSIIHHYHAEGKIKSEFSPMDVKRISYRNQYIFIWKNLTDPSILLTHIFWAPIRLIQSLMNGDMVHIQGFMLALGKIREILYKRSLSKKLRQRSDRDLVVL